VKGDEGAQIRIRFAVATLLLIFAAGPVTGVRSQSFYDARTGSAGSAAASLSGPNFPTPNTPYASARQMLFRQHMRVAPDKIGRPDKQFPELDCSKRREWEDSCRALFIWSTPDGWGNYVVVWVRRDDKLVSEAHFPFPVEGPFRAIPPRLPSDVPRLPAAYLRARVELRRLGFTPAGINDPGATCLDRRCKHEMKLRETICAVDAPYCNAYWIAPDGRALKVMTTGEFNGGRVYYETWITDKELKRAEK